MKKLQTTLMLCIVLFSFTLISCVPSEDTFNPKKPTYKYAYLDLESTNPNVGLVLSSYAMGDVSGGSLDMLKNGVHLFTAILNPASYKDGKLQDGVYKYESPNVAEAFARIVHSGSSGEFNQDPYGYVVSGTITVTSSGDRYTIKYSFTTKSGEVYEGEYGGAIQKFGERGNVDIADYLYNAKSDSLVLVELNSLRPNDKKWDLTKAMNSWDGVVLTNDRRVGILELKDISGEIPASIEKLNRLHSLTLKFAQSSNKNALPAEIWKLNRLSSLTLEGNFDAIPSGIKNLTELFALTLKGFTGNIPNEVWGLKKVGFLNLDGTGITIQDYSKFQELPSLSSLLLSNFSFSNGKIPAALYNLTALKSLYFYNCNVTEVEADIKKLTGLSSLTFLSCNLSTIAKELDNLTSLTELAICSNSATIAKIPEIYNLKSLKKLELYNSNIEGSIPGDLGKLTSLEELDLSGNSLTGTIPEGLTSLTKLKKINLKYNKLSGAIPQGLLNKFSSDSFCPQSGTVFTNLTCN